MASQSKTKTVKFEVGQLVEFNNRVGRVSKVAKSGAVYVIVLGETTVVNQTREELRVKKADLQLVNDVLERTGDAVSVEDYIRPVIRNNISCGVSSNAEMAANGTYELAPDYIPSLGCLEYCEWEGSEADKSVMHYLGIDLVKLANLYTGMKAEVGEAAPAGWDKIEAGHEVEELTQESESEAWVNVTQVQEEKEVSECPPVQLTLEESTQQATQNTIAVSHADNGGPAFSLESAMALAETTYALRELTFSVTRHSILTAFIDVALNKDIPGYHHKVASNIKNLMAASFDPVHDAMGYARINTWMRAALELVIAHKERVRKMLNQPIEAAPIKMDRVTKLGMWLDKNMQREGQQVDDLTAAYDSCYMYDAIGKKLEAYSFVVVEVIQSGDQGEMSVIPLPNVGKESTPFQEYRTAQSAIAIRKQCIDCYRPTEPDLHLYCGIVPILKTGRATQAAVEDVLASVIGSIKGIK